MHSQDGAFLKTASLISLRQQPFALAGKHKKFAPEALTQTTRSPFRLIQNQSVAGSQKNKTT